MYRHKGRGTWRGSYFSSDAISSTTDKPQDYITQKRQFGDGANLYGEPPAKKSAPSIRLGAGFKWNLQALAQAAEAVESGGKSPVSALNELGVRVRYAVLTQGGPAHCPCFTVAVTVADMTFEGWGHSKREARASAARACLCALLARAGRVLSVPAAHAHDFTSDEPAPQPVSEFQCLETKMRPPPAVVSKKPEDASPESAPSPPPAASPSTALFGASGSAPVHKSPINVLYETYPGLAFLCTFGDGSPLDAAQAPLQLSHSMRFKVVCTIKDQRFEGYGSSKKLAKLAAARSALAVLDEGRAEPAPAAQQAGFLPQTLADHIGKLVNEKFNEVMKGDLVHSKRKVLAGIVITTENRPEDSKVIAVTTGTKCVSGEHMSVRGRALNDTHAEVAARRCLQRYLYAQLLMYASAPDPRVPIPESDIEPVPSGGYQLRPARRVHLYVSTAPCGDGRIFSPHEQAGPEPDRHPNRLARGQLRTKIESGEGTIPVKNSNNVLQTWDGVLQGERLLTMSCSDKVARWCVVGLQGALLSRLLRPVYLRSLVLGSLLHPHHMYRAICGRIEGYISSLPPPFRLQRPLLARAASTEARTPARAPSFSVCWCATSPLPEIVNSTTGKLESGQPSLLCKQSMFARWQHLVRRLPLLQAEEGSMTEPAPLPDDLEHLLYNEAKQLCPSYQVAKERLIESFEKAKLGRWVKKPLEQDQFACELANADPTALFAWAGPSLEYSAVQASPGGPGGGRGQVVGNSKGDGNFGKSEVDVGNGKGSGVVGNASETGDFGNSEVIGFGNVGNEAVPGKLDNVNCELELDVSGNVGNKGGSGYFCNSKSSSNFSSSETSDKLDNGDSFDNFEIRNDASDSGNLGDSCNFGNSEDSGNVGNRGVSGKIGNRSGKSVGNVGEDALKSRKDGVKSVGGTKDGIGIEKYVGSGIGNGRKNDRRVSFGNTIVLGDPKGTVKDLRDSSGSTKGLDSDRDGNVRILKDGKDNNAIVHSGKNVKSLRDLSNVSVNKNEHPKNNTKGNEGSGKIQNIRLVRIQKLKETYKTWVLTGEYDSSANIGKLIDAPKDTKDIKGHLEERINSYDETISKIVNRTINVKGENFNETSTKNYELNNVRSIARNVTNENNKKYNCNVTNLSQLRVDTDNDDKIYSENIENIVKNQDTDKKHPTLEYIVKKLRNVKLANEFNGEKTKDTANNQFRLESKLTNLDNQTNVYKIIVDNAVAKSRDMKSKPHLFLKKHEKESNWSQNDKSIKNTETFVSPTSRYLKTKLELFKKNNDIT